MMGEKLVRIEKKTGLEPFQEKMTGLLLFTEEKKTVLRISRLKISNLPACGPIDFEPSLVYC